MDTPQPPDQPYQPPPDEGGAQPAPATEPGEVTQQYAADPGTQQQAYQPPGGQAAQQQAAEQAQQQADQHAQQAAQQQAQHQQAQPAQPYAQPAYQQPYGYQQQPYAQPAYQQPYGYPQYGGYYGQPAYYQPYNTGPDNNAASWSIGLSAGAVGLLFFTIGFSAPLSLIMAIVGIILGVKGKKAVDEGRTRKHRDMAVAGFWTGIAGVILSLLAIAAIVLFIVYVADSGGEADPGDLASVWRQFAPIIAA